MNLRLLHAWAIEDTQESVYENKDISVVSTSSFQRKYEEAVTYRVTRSVILLQFTIDMRC